MRSWRNLLLSWGPGEVLSAIWSRTGMVPSSPFFWSLLYKDPNRGMGEEGGEGVARQKGKQRSTVGVVPWVRSPTSSASGEAVGPEIVAEAKIGTYKSAELDLKPAACPTAQLAGPGSRWSGLGFLPPSPTPFGARIGQDSASRGCSVSGHHPMLLVSPGRWETLGGRIELQC